jgi:hypothetical protein
VNHRLPFFVSRFLKGKNVNNFKEVKPQLPEIPTSQSPTDSPRKQNLRALKRKKLLESGLQIEAGNEKRGVEKERN